MTFWIPLVKGRTPQVEQRVEQRAAGVTWRQRGVVATAGAGARGFRRTARGGLSQPAAASSSGAAVNTANSVCKRIFTPYLSVRFNGASWTSPTVRRRIGRFLRASASKQLFGGPAVPAVEQQSPRSLMRRPAL